MPYKVSFDDKDKLVLVRVFGKPTHEEHNSARAEAVRLCRENNCSEMLVDLRDLSTEKSSATTCYDFGESLAQADISPSTRIAHVLPTDPNSRKDVQFTATVAANRGRITGQFDTVDEAKKWLIHS